jgi:SAM-dependent methyltransferase
VRASSRPVENDLVVVWFERVADAYDAARPSYPSGVFDALGSLTGLLVLDVGAGTGIASRQLLARGATVFAIDAGSEVLHRAVARTAELVALVGDGVRLPLRDGEADLICFAQSWHWMDELRRGPEAHRVLREGGRWAGWWSHARADDEAWFDAYWSMVEQHCPGTHRTQRDTDWGAGLAGTGLFNVSDRIVVPWRREISIDEWLADLASHSYIAALPVAEGTRLLTGIRAVVEDAFPEGLMSIYYETWMWIGART